MSTVGVSSSLREPAVRPRVLPLEFHDWAQRLLLPIAEGLQLRHSGVAVFGLPRMGVSAQELENLVVARRLVMVVEVAKQSDDGTDCFLAGIRQGGLQGPPASAEIVRRCLPEWKNAEPTTSSTSWTYSRRRRLSWASNAV
jgi:hypothetical protein